MFITFEGIEGSGKSTQIGLLAGYLRGTGHEVLLTRQPGGCGLGLKLRSILLDAKNSHIDPLAELFLYLADRAQHVAEIIRPALDRGVSVICDRYTDSTLAYQGYGRGLSLTQLAELNSIATAGLVPDRTLLLDLEPAIGLARARKRNQSEGLAESEGRFEALELAFHEKVRQGYRHLAAADPRRFRVLDAASPPGQVFGLLLDALAFR